MNDGTIPSPADKPPGAGGSIRIDLTPTPAETTAPEIALEMRSPPAKPIPVDAATRLDPEMAMAQTEPIDAPKPPAPSAPAKKAPPQASAKPGPVVRSPAPTEKTIVGPPKVAPGAKPPANPTGAKPPANPTGAKPPTTIPPPAKPQAASAPAPAPVAPKAPPEWKVLEPEDRTDEVEHEVFECRSRKPDWTVVAASVRGKLHAHKAMWREDSYRWGEIDDWTILAVADGAGSAALSRIASRIACQTAVTELQGLLGQWKPGPGEKQPPDNDLQRLRVFLGTSAEAARLAILKEAQTRNRPQKEFYTTLLVIAHCPWQDRELVAGLQVGDGAVGLLAEDGFRRLGFADHGEYSSETRFLTTPGMELEFKNRVLFALPSRLKALALMSDGVADDFYPEDKRLVELFDSNPVEGLKTKAGEPVPGLLHSVAKDPRGGEALRDWLRYEKRGSSDDRTLLLMYRSGQS